MIPRYGLSTEAGKRCLIRHYVSHQDHAPGNGSTDRTFCNTRTRLRPIPVPGQVTS